MKDGVLAAQYFDPMPRNALILLEILGAGEANRTPDPNLGNIRFGNCLTKMRRYSGIF